MRKRCAILTSFDPSAYKGGIETYTRQMVTALQANDVEVDVFHTQRLPAATSDPPPTRAFHSPFLNDLYRVGRAFYHVDHQYDLAIAHAFFGFAYTPPRISTFTIFHSTHAQYAEANRDLFSPEWYFEVKYLFGLGAERLSTRGRRCIAVSAAVAEEITTYYGAATVTTLPTGVDHTIFFPHPNKRELREQYGIPREAFVGVFLARWGADKAIDVLEKVMAETPNVFWLLILGTGEPCPYKDRPNTRVVENIDRSEVAMLLSCADFLLHPSRYEGFGLSIAEGLACGLPVIAAPVGIAWSVLQSPPLRSLLLPPYREGKKRVIAAAVETIGRLRRDTDLCQACSHAGPIITNQLLNLQRWDKALLSALGLSGVTA